MKISHSSVAAYQACPRRYNFKYNGGIRKTAEDIGPRDLGSAVHGIMATVLRAIHKAGYKVDGYAALVEEAKNMWDADNRPTFTSEGEVGPDIFEWTDLLINSASIVMRLLDHLDIVNNYRIMEFNGEPMVEFNLEAVIGDHTFTGFIDVVWTDVNTGVVEVVDWKTTKQFKTWEDYQLDRQLPVYVSILEVMTGIKAVSGVYYQIRPAVPAEPALLKNGLAMSRSNITTDWPTYQAALLRNGFDPAEYQDMFEKLAVHDTYWYQPLYYMYTAYQLSFMWADFMNSVEDILKSSNYPGSFGYSCRFCEYRLLCAATITDGDASGLFESGVYYTKED